MEQLKIVAQALELPLDATVEKVVETITALTKAAKDGLVWKMRAETNLAKLDETSKIAQENAELRADAVIEKAKVAYKITAAEAVTLKRMYLSGPDGQKSVNELIDARADQEYLTRMHALHNVASRPPADPLAEIESRAAELMARDSKLTKGAAMGKVQDSDPALSARYREKMLGLSGGER